jgi:hypothetical protein
MTTFVLPCHSIPAKHLKIIREGRLPVKVNQLHLGSHSLTAAV